MKGNTLYSMCYYVQQKASAKKIAQTFNAEIKTGAAYKPQEIVSGFDFPLLPVLTAERPDTFSFMNWGLIPHWAKDKEIRNKTLNARIETIDKVPSYRDVTEQRCILPVTGFYEWKWLDSKGKRKEKYLIQIDNQEVFGLAGLYSSWIEPNEGIEIQSFTLLTTEANEIMAEIHNIKKRMPLMMSAELSKQWLQTGDILLTEDLLTRCVESDGQLDLFS